MTPALVRVLDVRFHVRDVRTRMPFRFGTAVLTGSPILHLDVRIHIQGHGESRGVAADGLPIRWFDKDPAKSPSQNIRDLIAGARAAARAYRARTELEALSPFDLWLTTHEDLAARGEAEGRNRLTSQHGPSLMDRAILDALGVAEGLGLRELVRRGRTGLRPEAVHPALQKMDWTAVLGRGRAPTRLLVRHTVGLSDPLRDGEIPPAQRLDDGYPQSLEACIAAYGLYYFKVKLSGRLDADRHRLREIGSVLDTIRRPYHVSLDGNEQIPDASMLRELLHGLSREAALARFRSSVLYVEQPFDRSAPLEHAAGLRDLPYPLLIDEADDGPEVFPRALAAGYRGVSSKSCKGAYKSMLNRLLVEHTNRGARELDRCFMTGEDLMNVAVVPLHQDTVLLGLLGIEHAERNGHHYVRGLDHLSATEREACLERHGGLYESLEDGARLAVRDGELDVRSLDVPGLGVGMATDFASMTPLETWLDHEGS